MDFTGIIAEYDPFHNGHAAQLAAVRAAGAQCIAVCMSSGAVQRGGVPILPESVRVRAALDAGADLVVALPAPYACATAEHALDLRSGAVAAHVLPQQQPQHNTRCQQQREEDGVFRVLIHLRVIRRPAAGLFLRFFLVLERIRQADAQQRAGLHVEVLRPVVVKLET